MPPAPWHIGTAPIIEPTRFMMPVDTATLSSLTGRSGNRRLFSSVIAMMAVPRVRGIWGRARTTAPTADARRDDAYRPRPAHPVGRLARRPGHAQRQPD